MYDDKTFTNLIRVSIVKYIYPLSNNIATDCTNNHSSRFGYLIRSN